MKFLLLFLFFVQDNKPEIRLPDLEHRIHESINAQRKGNEREPLLWDETLAGLARAHSEDMANRGYFKHVNPEGQTPLKRLEAAGYSACRLVGENIYQNNLYSRVITEKKRTTYDWNSLEKIVATTMKGWMDSAGQKESILDRNFTITGIGAAIASDDKVYITQLSCRPAS